MNVQLRPTWLGKTSARFKNSSAPFKQRVKLIACKPWTTPPPHNPPPPSTIPAPCQCQRPRLQQAGAQTHFIVNLLLYGWFITKGLPLSCPPLTRRARRLLLKDPTSNTRGHHLCNRHQRTSLKSLWYPRAVLMLTVNSFDPVLKMQNMKHRL